MNEEIKALIEREARKFTNEEHGLSNDSIHERYQTEKDFKAGANCALSLFRWRKVEEEDESNLPMRFKSVYIKTNWDRVQEGFRNHDGWSTDFELGGQEKIVEWMPIPQ